MPIDLTNIGGVKEEKSTTQQLDENTFIVGDHQVRRRGSISKQELEKSAWTPDKFVQDGQLTAKPDDGKVDKNTEWIHDDKNALE